MLKTVILFALCAIVLAEEKKEARSAAYPQEESEDTALPVKFPGSSHSSYSPEDKDLKTSPSHKTSRHEVHHNAQDEIPSYLLQTSRPIPSVHRNERPTSPYPEDYNNGDDNQQQLHGPQVNLLFPNPAILTRPFPQYPSENTDDVYVSQQEQIRPPTDGSILFPAPTQGPQRPQYPDETDGDFVPQQKIVPGHIGVVPRPPHNLRPQVQPTFHPLPQPEYGFGGNPRPGHVFINPGKGVGGNAKHPGNSHQGHGLGGNPHIIHVGQGLDGNVHPEQGFGGNVHPGQGFNENLYPGQGFGGNSHQGHGFGGNSHQGQGFGGNSHQGQGFGGNSHQGQGFSGNSHQGQGFGGNSHQGQGVGGNLHPGQGFGGNLHPAQGFAGNPHYEQGFGGNSHRLEDVIPGIPEKDYPTYSFVPTTSFHCKTEYPGFYADMEAGCQVWHYCQLDGRQDSFLCPNGTLFNQKYFVCDWWYNVDCAASQKYYPLNANLYREEPKPQHPRPTPPHRQPSIKYPQPGPSYPQPQVTVFPIPAPRPGHHLPIYSQVHELPEDELGYRAVKKSTN